jgi:hypothetical protein
MVNNGGAMNKLTSYQREILEEMNTSGADHVGLYGIPPIPHETLADVIPAWVPYPNEPFFILPDHQAMCEALTGKTIPAGARIVVPADESRFIDAYIADLNKYHNDKDVVVFGAGPGPKNLCYEFPLYDIERDVHFPLVSLKEKPEQPKCSPLFAKLMTRI